MKNKTIYMLIGGVAIVGLGYWWYKKSNEKKSGFVEGSGITQATGIGRKCHEPIPRPEQSNNCRAWEWNKHSCTWECKKNM